MLKQSITILLTLLFVVFTTYADEMSYEISMFGRAVGYTHYQLEHHDTDLAIQTTVLFNLGQGNLDQEIKLVANTRLNAQTLLPIEYHLSTYINGFTQSTIDTQFENHIATQVIAADGQNFNNQIELPKPTYIADSNFRIDHYNIVLGQYDFEKRGTQLFHILVPLAVPQLPETVELALTWVGQDQIIIGNASYQTDRLEAQTDSAKMEFWYAQDSKRIVKWTIPSQETTVVLSDSSVVSQEDLWAILRRTDLPRIVVERDMGNASDLASLQAHLDLNVVASGKPPIDLPHQVFDGEMSRNGERVHINGEVTVRSIKYAAEKSMSLPMAGIDLHEPYLQPAPQIESDHPEIQAKAEGITASAQTAYEATKAVIEQISGEIRYDVATVSAHECLSTKAGDALSSSRLAISLLRSLKIPARLLGGLLYVNDRQFIQHHWIEAYIGGDVGWMAVDALTGEAGQFSPGHIALWRGEGSCAPEVGEMKMRILDFQSTAIAWQDLIPLQVGSQTRYRFMVDGHTIGNSTSRVNGTLTYQGVKCYELQASLNLDDNTRGRIEAQSKMYLTLDGIPLFYHLDMVINGESESYEYIREGARLRGGTAGEKSILPVVKAAYFVEDDNPWQWDLVFRKQEFFTGMRREISVFNPQNGTLRQLQIEVEDAEEITVDAETFQCFRINVSGKLAWISSVGWLIRYEDAMQKLVIELEAQK